MLASLSKLTAIEKKIDRLLPPTTRKGQSTEQFARYHDDPVGFARDILLTRLWSRQAEIANATARHPRVAVRSGHKIGKSTVAAVIALWWLCTRGRARVVMTSASGRQVRSILWKEVSRLYARATRKSGNKTVSRIGGKLHKVPDRGLQFADGREVIGFSTHEPEKMAGMSGDELLFIVDEASGVPEAIFEAIEGNRAGGARIVMFGNPTQQSGTLYDSFHTKREFWVCIHVSSEESPNVVHGKLLFRGLATREWVEEKRRDWGTNSPVYQVRVRGDFADQADNAVIGLALVETASGRWLETPAEGQLEFGVDPGALR
jgi:phage terminase large subunit